MYRIYRVTASKGRVVHTLIARRPTLEAAEAFVAAQADAGRPDFWMQYAPDARPRFPSRVIQLRRRGRAA